MMNTIECMKSRRSVRAFKPDKISHEILEQAIDAAAYAPSWKNTQITRYIAIENEQLRTRIAEECCEGNNRRIILNAPLVVAVTLIEKRSGYERDGSFTTIKGEDWQNYDCGLASGFFTLAAHELGLASVIVGIFDYQRTAALIEVPEGQRLMALIAVGYADETPDVPKKKSVTDLLTYR